MAFVLFSGDLKTETDARRNLKIVARHTRCGERWWEPRKANLTVTYSRIADIKAPHPPGRHVKLNHSTNINVPDFSH